MLMLVRSMYQYSPVRGAQEKLSTGLSAGARCTSPLETPFPLIETW